MPTLIIDNRRIEAAQGAKVIEAAEQAGIMIPRFCYHKALSSAGACRVCAVKFMDGPVRGIHMSCMVDARDGMIVSTTDPEVVEFRKYVIELLMLNHPHDCPVCDEGGHCLLQDYTVSGGHGLRRYMGPKRTYRDQYLGQLVAHEMNRCVHCYRCVRFYRQYCGYRDFGVLQTGSRVFFGRHAAGPLQSPFSGNLVDICPTGAFTDLISRYRVRRWDLERGPSVCIHCCLGCNTISGARYREVLRQEARFNEHINGYFICDRGRSGFQYESHEDRPRTALINGCPTDMKKAIDTVSRKIDETIENHGPAAVACLGSSRNSLETQAMLHRFCRVKKIPEPVYFIDCCMAKKVKSAVFSLNSQVAASLKDVEQADFILALGVDPINEAPMLALAINQAVRKGASVVLADPRPVSLPFEFHHAAIAVENLKGFLFAFVKKALDVESYMKLDKQGQDFVDTLAHDFFSEDLPMDSSIVQNLKTWGEKLRLSKKPVLICGTQVVDETLPEASADAARLIFQLKKKTGLFYIFPVANSFGAALWDRSEKYCFEDIIDNILEGKTKILVVVENNPMFHFPDQARLKEAIKKLDLFVVLDYVPSPTMRRAGIFIPSTTVFESGGSFINQEGRIQYAHPIHLGGIPVYQKSKGTHPERAYGRGIPGKDPKASWEILAMMSGLIPDNAPGEIDLGELIFSGHELFSTHRSSDYPLENVRVIPVETEGKPFSGVFQRDVRAKFKGLKILTVDQTFGTEVLSAFSEASCKLEPLPFVIMHPEDAAEAKVAEAKKIAIQLPGGILEAELLKKRNMARGILVLPRHRQLPWQKFTGFSQRIDFEAIKAVE